VKLCQFPSPVRSQPMYTTHRAWYMQAMSTFLLQTDSQSSFLTQSVLWNCPWMSASWLSRCHHKYWAGNVVLQEVDGCWNASVAECQHRRPGHSVPTGTVERGRSDTGELSLPICDLQKSFSFNMTLNSIVTQAFRVISKHIVANTRYTFGGTRVRKVWNSWRDVQRHCHHVIMTSY